jgi:hypothetical protein
MLPHCQFAHLHFAAKTLQTHLMDCNLRRLPMATAAPYTFLFAPNRIYEG